jgi:hypothetical protein
MKSRKRRYRPLNVSNSRWRAYAVASLATASGGAISAEGAIHYSGLVNFKFDSRLSETHTFPLSQVVFLKGFRKEVGFYEHSASFAIQGAAVSNAIRDYKYSTVFFQSVPKPLPKGAVISHGYFGRSGFGRLQYYNCGFPGWVEAGTHAIGFRFNSGRGVQYGWVRIKWLGCSDNKYIVKDYAWGDPGDQIKAGQTQLEEDATPVAPQASKKAETAPMSGSQDSLGLLAVGAAGLLAWRKSRRGVNSVEL